MRRRDGVLACDGNGMCLGTVSHIDEKGYIYCPEHGKWRKSYMRCRKLKPKELKQLASGEPLASYSRGGAA